MESNALYNNFSFFFFILNIFKLKQKEITYMKVLADEWKKRDKEREIVLQKKVLIFSFVLYAILGISIQVVETYEQCFNWHTSMCV